MTELSDITTFYKQLRDEVYNEAHDLMRDWDDLYHKKIKLLKPAKQPAYYPPDAFREVEKAQSQIATGHPVYEVLPDDTKEQAKTASKIKQVCEMTRKYNSRRLRGNYDRIKGFYLALRGMGVVKGPLYVPGLRFPIVVQPIDPLHFFPDPSGFFVICAYKRTVASIKSELNQWNDSAGDEVYKVSDLGHLNKDYAEVEWIEYWTADKRAFVVKAGHESIPVSDMQDNKYGFIPFAWQYSGRGTGSDGLPENRMVGILAGLEDTIRAQARALTAWDFQLRKDVYSTLVVNEDYAEYYQQDRNPGDLIPVPRGGMPSEKGVEEMPQSSAHPELWNYMNLNTKYMEQLGGTGALMGEAGMAESGILQMSRIRQTSLHYIPMREASEAIDSEIYTNMCRLLKNDLIVTEPIRIDSKTKLSGDEIDEFTEVNVEFEAADPLYDHERVEQGMRLAERNFITLEDLHRDYLKTANPEEKRGEIFAEKVLFTSPEIIQSFGKKHLEEHGFDEEAQAIEEMMVQSVGQGGGEKQTVDPRALHRIPGPSGNEPGV